MTLSVTERQSTETWYELWGDLEAKELFPTLLPNSESVVEVEEAIKTEAEVGDGRYDGCPAEEDQMEDEIAEFTESAMAEFRDEAIAAAKTVLSSLKPGQTLMRGNFEEQEEAILEEAAKELGIIMPWDPAEAAQIAAAEAAEKVRLQRMLEEEELRKKQTAEALEKARALFMAGNSHSAVRSLFPSFSGPIANLVGELRRNGVQIPR